MADSTTVRHTRRELLAKAAVGGVVIWAAPMITSAPAFAGAVVTGTRQCCTAEASFSPQPVTLTQGQVQLASFACNLRFVSIESVCFGVTFAPGTFTQGEVFLINLEGDQGSAFGFTGSAGNNDQRTICTSSGDPEANLFLDGSEAFDFSMFTGSATVNSVAVTVCGIVA